MTYRARCAGRRADLARKRWRCRYTFDGTDPAYEGPRCERKFCHRGPHTHDPWDTGRLAFYGSLVCEAPAFNMRLTF